MEVLRGAPECIPKFLGDVCKKKLEKKAGGSRSGEMSNPTLGRVFQRNKWSSDVLGGLNVVELCASSRGWKMNL